MSSLRLSQKHGVNPSVGVCFWCGKDSEVILFGLLPKDAEAPHKVCLNYDPCKECEDQFRKGVLVIEVADVGTENQIAFSKDDKGNPTYPTGRMVVITFEAAERLFGLKNTSAIQMSVLDFTSIFTGEDNQVLQP